MPIPLNTSLGKTTCSIRRKPQNIQVVTSYFCVILSIYRAAWIFCNEDMIEQEGLEHG